METIKTGVVVTLLLGVLYGVYTVLNKTPAPTPPELAQQMDDLEGGLTVDFDPELAFPEEPDTGASMGLDAPPPIPPAPSHSGDFAGAVPRRPSMPGALDAPEMPLDPTDSSATPLASAPSVAAPPLVGDGSLPPLPGGDLALPPSPTGTGQGNVGFPANQFADNQAGADNHAGADNAADITAAAPSPIDSLPPVPPPSDYAGVPPLTSGPAGPSAQAPPSYGDLPPTSLPTGGLDSDPPPVPDMAAAPASADEPRQIQSALLAARAHQERGEYEQALFALSLYYRDPDATPEEHEQLLAKLDELAGFVVYSRNHLLAPAHTVLPGETMDQIAQQYQVPAELLENINGIPHGAAPQPGAELKVVPGPLQAEVDLTRREITLFIKKRLYAGRFLFQEGADPAPQEGEFSVVARTERPNYVGAAGTLAGGDPANPYGLHLVDLGSVKLHGTPQAPTAGSTGCVQLTPQDARDLYSILSVGSQVVVRR